MKKQNAYHKIKWISFSLTAALLAASIVIIFLIQPQETVSEPPEVLKPTTQKEATNGHYTNAAIGSLMEETLSELDFIEDLHFNGQDDGQFSICCKLSSPKNLTTVFADLKPYEAILSTLKGEQLNIKGHLGENELGTAQVIVDSITFADYSIPAASATMYIAKYTSLNDLFEVPLEQISIDEKGIYFSDEIPTAIRIASYNLIVPSSEANSAR
jgi:hypothetical protein